MRPRLHWRNHRPQKRREMVQTATIRRVAIRVNTAAMMINPLTRQPFPAASMADTISSFIIAFINSGFSLCRVSCSACSRKDVCSYTSFVEQAHDTFRWKGENVRTTEMSEAICTFLGRHWVEGSCWSKKCVGPEGKLLQHKARYVLKTGRVSS